MIRVLTCAALLFALPAQALPGFPDGRYVGSGQMQTPAGAMPYDSALILTADGLEAEYDFGVRSVSYAAKIANLDGGKFDLVDADGKLIGTGECVAETCRLDMSSFHAEETLTYKDGAISRVGSMQHSGMTVRYTEELRAE